MPHVPVAKLIQLQQNASHIRNICILAHVDHGKTSLADSLIATNGIISPKLAGKVRYLDSRPDEQLRGITMESSAISLYFSMLRRHSSPTDATSDEPVSTKEEYLVNLVDSPGHIDFSSEVSTASRLSDAAVILVDAVEGVCSQTVTVLRQVWSEKLKPLLVINKIDRLITELKMSPLEAYAHLERVLEGVNAVIGAFRMGERMEEDLLWREMQDTKLRGREDGDMVDADNKIDSDLDSAAQFEDKDDEDLYFAPDKNNVIFASAIDGWAFALGQFSSLYSKKLNINRSVLESVLWGDYYLDPKTKKVLAQKHLKGRNLKPIFVQLVLEPIWTVYDATVGISAAAGGSNGKGGGGDPALLEKITKSLNITLPAHVQRSRDPKSILHAVFASWLPLSTALLVSVVEYLPSPIDAQAARMPALIDDLVGAKAIDIRIKKSMINFNTEPDAPVVAYVSKMVAIPESELPSKTRARTTGSNSTLTPDEARELARRKRAEIAKASRTIFGIGGLEGHILKTGTLCSQVHGGINLATTSSTQSASKPIVRVALEPTNPTDLNKMIRGLKLLEQSDPCAMYEQLPNGEHVILTAGELHLERCLKDLRERYARCDVQTGDLIVPYRETIVKPREDDVSAPVVETTANNDNKPKGTVITVPASKTVSVKLRVTPLPKLLTDFLIENGASVRKLYAEKQAEGSRRSRGQEKSVLSMSEFRKQLQAVAAAAGAVADECEERDDNTKEGEGEKMSWKEAVQHICAFGPRRAGPNIFVDATDNTGRLTGELINAVRESIRSGFLEWSPRILLAMYRCTIQVTPDVLGRVYAVLTRRRGTIQSEQLLEGTPYFTIEASLPVAESLGFSEELRKRTSGLAAQPMLQFTGFDILDDLDPFWVPKTEEELEELGVHGERENVAKRYVDSVRRRKGLLVRSARGGGRDAEKQKTLKTN
ncbi:hypothetical protein DV736_g3391, partial [Chaetothyriales sp. CBS 134916]